MPHTVPNLGYDVPDENDPQGGPAGAELLVTAALDAIDAVFDGATGHSHDGTDGEGPTIPLANVALSGLTTGHIYTATGAASAAFQAPTAGASETFGVVFNNLGEVSLHNDGSIVTKRY